MSRVFSYQTRFPGGMTSITALRTIAELSMARGTSELCFTSDQQLEFDLRDELCASDEEKLVLQRRNLRGPLPPASTVGVVEWQKGYDWLSTGTFQEVFDTLPKTHHIRVGISDWAQPYLPIYQGDLIFLATSIPYYWQIAMREPDGVVQHLPWAIPSQSIGAVVHALDIEASTVVPLMATHVESIVKNDFEHVIVPMPEMPAPPKRAHDTITGLHPHPSGDRYILGIYPEHGIVSAQFLLELCLLSRSGDVGTVCLTPYRSLLVPNIPVDFTARWKQLIGRFGLAMNPPDIASQCIVGTSPEARKRFPRVLHSLEQSNVHASGLSISFLCQPTECESMIRIERSHQRFPAMDLLFPRYDLYCHPRFDTRLQRLKCIDSHLTSRQLVDALERLIRTFNLGEFQVNFTSEEAIENEPAHFMECAICSTRYEDAYGDASSRVDPGTPFADVPVSWACPVCESPREMYVSA